MSRKLKTQFENSNSVVFNTTPLHPYYGPRAHHLLKDNILDFRFIIGDISFTIKDSENRRLHCWTVELKESTVWLITAKVRGTSYEYVGDVNEVQGFMIELLSKLEALDQLKKSLPQPSL